MQSKIVQAVIYHNCDDCGLQLMKTPNPQKCDYYMQSIEQGLYIEQYRTSEKYKHAYVLTTWFGPLWQQLLPQCSSSWKLSACGTAEVLWLN